MKIENLPRVLQGMCILALVALVLFVWSLLDPHPIPVILAMSVGQVLGTLSFAGFLLVVVLDLRTGLRQGAQAAAAPPPHTKEATKSD